MQPREWIYSNTHTNDMEYDNALVTEEGTAICKVIDASYIPYGLMDDKNGNPMSEQYKITVKFIDGINVGGGFTDTVWLSDKFQNKSLKGFGVLGSLGKAIYGEKQDVPPAPDDVIGCVVEATVTFVNGYPHIYHYAPASIRYLDRSDKEDQYFKD